MYHIIINPASGSGKGLKVWHKKIEPALQHRGVSYTPYFSEKSGDVAKLAENILITDRSRPIVIVVIGGDGSLNEALYGMPDTDAVILGYIPTGSSNDLARDLNLPKNPIDALDIVVNTGRPMFMDLARLTYDDGSERLFAVSCGIGFDAAVCEEVKHVKMKSFLNKCGLGVLTYLGVALKQLFTAQEVSCRIFLDDNSPIEIKSFLFIAAMLHRYEGGGFKFCPAADDRDGLLNICTVGKLPKLLILLALPTAYLGIHYIFKGITHYTASCIRVEASKPLWVHTDGEVTRTSCSFTASCLPKSIQLLIP